MIVTATLPFPLLLLPLCHFQLLHPFPFPFCALQLPTFFLLKFNHSSFLTFPFLPSSFFPYPHFLSSTLFPFHSLISISFPSLPFFQLPSISYLLYRSHRTILYPLLIFHSLFFVTFPLSLRFHSITPYSYPSIPLYPFLFLPTLSFPLFDFISSSFHFPQAQKMLDDPTCNDKVGTSVKLLNKLARILRQRRIDQGALTLASPEVKYDPFPCCPILSIIDAMSFIAALSLFHPVPYHLIPPFS